MTAPDPGELAPLDALMLKADADPALRAIMTGVLVLDGVPDWERLVATFEAAIAAVPRLRHKVVAPLLPVGPPEWVPDPDFDLSYHLRRTAAPGDGSLAQVLGAASARATAPFDRARPLWEATLYEGTPDGAVLAIRAHHALTDGVGALEILGALMDLEPDPAPAAASEPEPPQPPGAAAEPEAAVTPARLLVNRLTWGPLQLANLLERNLSYTVAAGRAALLPAESVAKLTSWAGSLRRLLSATGAAPSPLLRARSRARRFAALDVPLAELKEAAHAAGGTVNDAYLAGVLGGFRRYIDKRGGTPGDVPMALPINVRGTATGISGGNQFSATVIPGPATIEDPAARIRRVAELVRQARAEPGLDAAARLAPVMAQLPGVVATLSLAAHARRVDLQASNVMGAPVPVWLAGRRVRRLYPFGPLPGLPVMVVLLSHDGTCCVGINLDPAAIEDPDLFVACLAEGFDEVLDGRTVTVTAARPA